MQYGNKPTRVYYQRASQGRRLNVKSGKKGYADHGTHVGYPAKITRHAQDASKLKTSSLEVLVFPEEYYLGPNCVFDEISPLFDTKNLPSDLFTIPDGSFKSLVIKSEAATTSGEDKRTPAALIIGAGPFNLYTHT